MEVKGWKVCWIKNSLQANKNIFVKFLISDFGGQFVVLENSDMFCVFFQVMAVLKNHMEILTIAFQRDII